MHENDLMAKLASMAKDYPSIIKVTLFGSRARGHFHHSSDFDISVSCKDEKDFWGFYFDVEDIDTFYKIDVLWHETILNDVLIKEIKKDGVVLYERKA